MTVSEKQMWWSFLSDQLCNCAFDFESLRFWMIFLEFIIEGNLHKRDKSDTGIADQKMNFKIEMATFRRGPLKYEN